MPTGCRARAAIAAVSWSEASAPRWSVRCRWTWPWRTCRTCPTSKWAMRWSCSAVRQTTRSPSTSSPSPPGSFPTSCWCGSAAGARVSICAAASPCCAPRWPATKLPTSSQSRAERMRIVDLIEKKRDGGTHSREELEVLVGGYVRGDVPDYQMAAWLMAVCWRGMPPEEAATLTRVMAASGERLDLSVIGKPVADKHSTGGVGDKTSLVVMPLVAGCGVPVGKMSGRGLGFTGGTVDKLESFPGIRVNLDAAAFVSQLRDIGLVITGQSADLAPADGKLYALRDVTATVPSLPLIASSIMSKKLAAGADVIVLDVKTGSGAFMRERDSARALAPAMIDIGEAARRRVAAS